MSRLVLAQLVSLLTLAVGVGVWFKSSRSTTSTYFCLFTSAVALWTSANGLIHTFADTSLGPAYARLTFFAASFVALLFFLFCTAFPHPRELPVAFTILGRIWQFLGVAFAIAATTPLIVRDTRFEDDSLLVTYGPLHLPFGVYFVACFLSALTLLHRRRRVLPPAQKTAAGLLLVSVLLAALGATLTNLAFPLLLGISRYGQYGPLFTLLLISLVGHSIIRHSLLDIKVVVRQGAVLAGALVVTLALMYGALAIVPLLITPHQSSALSILTALTAGLLFNPIRSFVQASFDRYLYRQPYNYRQTVHEVSQAFRTTIQLRLMFQHLQRAIDTTIKPTVSAVYLYSRDTLDFSLAWSVTPDAYPSVVSVSESVVDSLTSATYPLLFDDKHSAFREFVRLDGFPATSLRVVAPLVDESGVLGFLAFGPRLRDNPYFSDDLNLIATLANQSSVVIRNAETHQHVVRLNEELKTILHTLDSAVITADTKERITLFNPAAKNVTGIATEGAIGPSLVDLPHALAMHMRATLTSGIACSQVEFSLPDASGQVVPLVCSVSPLLDARMSVLGVVAVVSDITHLKALEHEKRRAERLSLIDALAAGLVHEIRNPLVAIKTFSHLLSTKYNDPEFRETFSRTTGREIRRIDSLLTRFGTLTTASSQPFENVDAMDPIAHTLDVLKPQLDNHKISVRLVADGAPRRILGNIIQLEQLFLNLCLNAMEAMDGGGELTVRVADLADGGGTTLLVEISDTGTGIREDLLSTIFDAFVSTKARSSGLGLAICRAVADAHRARLSARNNVGRPGSTFTIEFPVPVSVASPAAAT
jgi:PAS domain S-box-containing protein